MKRSYVTLSLIITGISIIFGNENKDNTRHKYSTNKDVLYICCVEDSSCEDSDLQCSIHTALAENINLNSLEGKKYQTSNNILRPRIYPNPAHIGEYVTITNVLKGTEIYIYDVNNVFIKSQIIDRDQYINTIDLRNGEYIIRTENLYLKLNIE